jgi:hypothetical protein
MPKRQLRIVRFTFPLTGICEHCNQTFLSQKEQPSAAQGEVNASFEAHKRKPVDSSQNALRIVRQATENK